MSIVYTRIVQFVLSVHYLMEYTGWGNGVEAFKNRTVGKLVKPFSYGAKTR